MSWQPWRRTPAEDSGADQPGSVATTTATSNFMTRAVTVVLSAALVTGPAALAMAVLGGGSATGSSTSQPAPVVTVGEQVAVEEFSQRFVVAWLRTDRDHTDQLGGYVEIPPAARFPVTAASVTEPAVAGVVALGGHRWSVTVSAVVTAPGKPVRSVRRYYTVAVTYDAGAVAAEVLPSPVAAPAVAAVPELAYGQELASSDPAWKTTQEFLGALCAGQGDITRYLTPGTQLSPVLPPLFSAVEVTEIRTTDEAQLQSSTVPADATTRQLLVTATGRSAGQDLTVQYALTVTARAGRWEVTALDPAPQTTPAEPASPITPATPTE